MNNRSNCQHPLDQRKSKRIPENIYFCFIDYVKGFVWITTNCGKFFKRWDYQTTWPASWEICMQVRKRQFELDMEQWTGSKLGKEYIKLYIVPCLFNLYADNIMQNARLDEAQPGIKTAQINVNKLRICRWYLCNGRKPRGTKEALHEVEGGEWKSWLKTQHLKN